MNVCHYLSGGNHDCFSPFLYDLNFFHWFILVLFGGILFLVGTWMSGRTQ